MPPEENQDPKTTINNGVEGEAVQSEVVSDESLNDVQDDKPQLDNDESQNAEESTPSSREALIEEIASRRREEREEQLPLDANDFDQDGGDDSEEEDDTTVINVNGQTLKVKTEDVLAQGIRTLQKETAADARLKKANEKAAEIDARERALAEREAKFSRGLATDEQIDADAERFSESLVTDEAKAGEMFKQVLKDNRDLKAVTAELISDTRETRQERIARKKKEREDMVKHYHTNFTDIAKDTHLTTIFNAEATKVKRENPDLDYKDVFEKAGSVVREKYIPDSTASSPESVVERKRNMRKQPRSAGGRVNIKRPAPPKAKSKPEIIAEIKQARGQG